MFCTFLCINLCPTCTSCNSMKAVTHLHLDTTVSQQLSITPSVTYTSCPTSPDSMIVQQLNISLYFFFIVSGSASDSVCHLLVWNQGRPGNLVYFWVILVPDVLGYWNPNSLRWTPIPATPASWVLETLTWVSLASWVHSPGPGRQPPCRWPGSRGIFSPMVPEACVNPWISFLPTKNSRLRHHPTAKFLLCWCPAATTLCSERLVVEVWPVPCATACCSRAGCGSRVCVCVCVLWNPSRLYKLEMWIGQFWTNFTQISPPSQADMWLWFLPHICMQRLHCCALLMLFAIARSDVRSLPAQCCQAPTHPSNWTLFLVNSSEVRLDISLRQPDHYITLPFWIFTSFTAPANLHNRLKTREIFSKSQKFEPWWSFPFHHFCKSQQNWNITITKFMKFHKNFTPPNDELTFSTHLVLHFCHYVCWIVFTWHMWQIDSPLSPCPIAIVSRFNVLQLSSEVCRFAFTMAAVLSIFISKFRLHANDELQSTCFPSSLNFMMSDRRPSARQISSANTFRRYIAFLAPSFPATYSASHELWATTGCFLEHQSIRFPFK